MNIFDYLAGEFASFDEAPLNPVDSAILTQFAMVRADGLVPEAHLDGASRVKDAFARALPRSIGSARFSDLLRAERYSDMFCGLAPNRVKDNLLALAASPRFRDLALREYASVFDEERDTQFGAVCFVHGRDFAYIAFRGTDTSVTGWRENFNMAYTSPVPAQALALRYLEAVAPRLPKRLIVGGHSKGANLALYAALKADPKVQDRIEMVYAHDGPGFKPGAVTDAEWERLSGRIHRTAPQESVVGLIMHCPAPLRVVRADEHGLAQHSPFTWEVDGRDFVYADALSDSSRFFQEVLAEWLARYSDDEAAQIVDALFKAVEAAGATDATNVFMGGIKTLPLIAAAAKDIDGPSREVLNGALKSLGAVMAGRAGQGLRERFARQEADEPDR